MTNQIGRRRLVGLLGGGAAALLAACGAPPSAPTPTTAQPAKPADTKPAAAPTTAPAAAPTTAPAAAPTTAPATGAATKPAAQATPAAGAAPSAQAAAKPGQKGGTFNYAEAGDFNDFNPWTYTAVNFELYNQVFSRLTWKDGAGKVNPDLAESWQLSPDNLSLKLKLRDGVRWHDGKEFTAQDYVTMFGYLKDEALSKHTGVTKIRGLLSPVKDVVASDRSSLELKFDKPTPFALDLLDYFYAIRIDDKADPSFLKKLPVGTGPFKLTEWTANQQARMVKNPDYYNKDLPLLNEVVFKRLTQAETLLPNLKSGTLDGVLMTSLSDVAPLQADKAYTVDVNENSGSIFNIQVNVSKPPFDKKEVRQALSYSLNRVELARSAFFGVSRPIASAFYSPASIAYREDLVGAHAFSLDKARQLLDAAGVKSLDLTIVVTPAWPQMKLFSLVWQQDLKKIGLNLKINDVENAKFYEINSAKDMQGNDLQAWLNARTIRDPAIFWSTQGNYRGGGTSTNRFGFESPELEKLIADGAAETDPEKRKKLYQQANEMQIEQSNVINVATNPRVWAYGKAAGLRVDLNGNLVMDQAALTR
ncbi:MAG TPA: ABC transporter substrate-binding protein [Chloroflexota bacterium]